MTARICFHASSVRRLRVIALMLVLVGIVSRSTLAADRPNILFILVDDMGWPDVACYGHAFHDTPNIDRLASQGVKFTDFYAATPVCSSTRSTIQTGQYSARTAITDFIPGHWRPFEKLVVPKIEHYLQPGIRTPGHVLKDAGYATGYFGKWHLGWGRDQQPDKWGYDVTTYQLGADFKKWQREHGRSANAPGPKKIDLLTDQTLYFIEQHKDRPWFVTLSHHSVHIRIEARPDTLKKYQEKKKPKEGVNNPAYAAMVEDLDGTVGRIMERLDELDLTKNTIVVFTSDNGGLRKIYTGVGEVVSTNSPLRDEKGTLYEGGIRVPMIVRWPGVVKPGSVCDEPTTTADLLPTFTTMGGGKPPKQPIDGADMTPLLKNAQANLPRDAIYFHYPHYHHSIPGGAIRAGNYKLIEWFGPTSADSRFELYDLSKDLGEQVDLASTMPRRVKQMRGMLAEWRQRVGARMPTPNAKHDPKRAHEWWSRRTQKPLDIEAMRKRYETQKNR